MVEASITVPIATDLAFAVSQTTAPVRYQWDPFVREQYFLDGATRPEKGVRTYTRSRHGLVMISEYVSFQPPSHVGMKMVRGPWFFTMFAGGWRFTGATESGHTVATWRYNFRCQPGPLRAIAEWVGTRLLRRDIRRRIIGYARGCVNPAVLEAAQKTLAEHNGDQNALSPQTAETTIVCVNIPRSACASVEVSGERVE